MRQLAPPEQGHERRRERLQPLVILGKCRFTTERIADQHSNKVDHLIGAKAFPCEANAVAESGQHSQMGQIVRDESNFAKPGRNGGDRLWRSLDTD